MSSMRTTLRIILSLIFVGGALSVHVELNRYVDREKQCPAGGDCGYINLRRGGYVMFTLPRSPTYTGILPMHVQTTEHSLGELANKFHIPEKYKNVHVWIYLRGYEWGCLRDERKGKDGKAKCVDCVTMIHDGKEEDICGSFNSIIGRSPFGPYSWDDSFYIKSGDHGQSHTPKLFFFYFE